MYTTAVILNILVPSYQCNILAYMYLYIIALGFNKLADSPTTFARILMRLMYTDMDDMEFLLTYYKELVGIDEIQIKMIEIERNIYNKITGEFGVIFKEYKPWDRNVPSSVYYEFNNLNIDDIIADISTNIQILVESTTKISLLKDKYKYCTNVEPISFPPRIVPQLADKVNDEESETMLDKFYTTESFYMSRPEPTEITSFENNSSGLFEEIATSEHQYKLSDSYTRIILARSCFSSEIKILIDDKLWIESLRDKKLANIIPEVVLCTSYKFRNTPEINNLLSTYLVFFNTTTKKTLTEIQSQFFKLAELLGDSDNLTEEGYDYNLSTNFTQSSSTKYEHEMLSKYSNAINNQNSPQFDELFTCVAEYFAKNYMKKSDNSVTIDIIYNVFDVLLHKHLSKTIFSRFESLKTGRNDAIFNKVMTHYYGKDLNCMFDFQLIKLIDSTLLLESESQYLCSLYFAHSITNNITIRDTLQIELIKQFFTNCIKTNVSNSTIQSRELWKSFVTYVQTINAENILRSLGQNEFTPICKSLGYIVKRTASGMSWQNLKLEPVMKVAHITQTNTTKIEDYATELVKEIERRGASTSYDDFVESISNTITLSNSFLESRFCNRKL